MGKLKIYSFSGRYPFEEIQRHQYTGTVVNQNLWKENRQILYDHDVVHYLTEMWHHMLVNILNIHW